MHRFVFDIKDEESPRIVSSAIHRHAWTEIASICTFDTLVNLRLVATWMKEVVNNLPRYVYIVKQIHFALDYKRHSFAMVHHILSHCHAYQDEALFMVFLDVYSVAYIEIAFSFLCSLGCMPFVESMIKYGVSNFRWALAEAAAGGHLDIFYLLETRKESEGESVQEYVIFLARAIEGNHERMIGYLLSKILSFNIISNLEPALYQAAKRKNYDLVRFIISNKGSKITWSSLHRTLYVACRGASVEFLEFLVSNESYPDTIDWTLATYEAACFNRIDVLNYISSKVVTINLSFVMVGAAKGGDLELMKRATSYGANVWNEAADIAANKGRHEILSYCIDHGAILIARFFTQAVKKSRWGIVDWLAQLADEKNEPLPWGKCIKRTVIENRIDLFEKYLPRIQFDKQFAVRCLFHATRLGHIDMIEYLESYPQMKSLTNIQ